MKRRDWFLRVMVALLAVGVWVLILRPVLAPTPTRAAEAATAAQDEVRAKRFVLVDEEGRERAALEMAQPSDDSTGRPTLTLRNGDGAARAILELSLRGSGWLTLYDKEGALRYRARPDAPTPEPEVANEPLAVAKQYFRHLREGEVEEARALAHFEDETAEQEWERQVQDYVQRRAAGGRKWWGDPFKVQLIPGTPPEKWAFVEVQWRYLGAQGWLMAQHYTYKMRTFDRKWGIMVDSETTRSGIPWVPAEEP